MISYILYQLLHFFINNFPPIFSSVLHTTPSFHFSSPPSLSASLSSSRSDREVAQDLKFIFTHFSSSSPTAILCQPTSICVVTSASKLPHHFVFVCFLGVVFVVHSRLYTVNNLWLNQLPVYNKSLFLAPII